MTRFSRRFAIVIAACFVLTPMTALAADVDADGANATIVDETDHVCLVVC